MPRAVLSVNVANSGRPFVEPRSTRAAGRMTCDGKTDRQRESDDGAQDRENEANPQALGQN